MVEPGSSKPTSQSPPGADDVPIHADLVPNAAADVLPAVAHVLDAPQPDSPETRLLLEEIRRQELSGSGTWIRAAVILIGSMALFLALGQAFWSWQFTLGLIAVLLFHELGHFIAMKAFKYQNVQMFFIPLFGAAVSGQHYRIAGWKKVIVSLMGPVPGILLGVPLSLLAVATDQSWLMQGTMLLILLNAFNLLPALPLDGGWIMHGLLFSRHPSLDLVFRIVAIALLVATGRMPGGSILTGIAIVMAIGLPAAHRVAKVTSRLRCEPDLVVDSDTHTVPGHAVQRISQELERYQLKGMSIRNKARMVRQIFEQINTSPPGWLASVGLGGVYCGALALAIATTGFLVLAQRGDLDEIFSDAAPGPQPPVAAWDREVGAEMFFSPAP